MTAFAGLLLHTPLSRAEDRPDSSDKTVASLDYVLGAAVSRAAEFAGALRDKSTLTPLWALRYGRWRISTSGAGKVLGFGEAVEGPGLSTELLSIDGLRAGLAVGIDSGRQSRDSSALRGLPDIESTLRMRVFASYQITPQWLLAGSFAQDMLGRGGGGQFGLETGYAWRLGPLTEWNLSIGLGAASAPYMRSYFGVGDAAALSSGLPAYRPGASLSDAYIGLGFTHALSSRWILFGSASHSRLLSEAALSPLAQRRESDAVALGLAYRCCRWQGKP